MCSSILQVTDVSTMRTIVEGESSKETSVDSGVLQGTVLGPIMFLCHINENFFSGGPVLR
jgi:hypothetical protein